MLFHLPKLTKVRTGLFCSTCNHHLGLNWWLFSLTQTHQFTPNLTRTGWLPLSLRLETTHSHITIWVPCQFAQCSSKKQPVLCAVSSQTWWKLRGKGGQVALKRSSIWNVHANIGRVWQSRAAPAFTSSPTERRITIGGRRAATHQVSETFLTCLVSLHRRRILLACKYTRVLVIKRVAWQNLSQVWVFQLPLHAYKWVILMDDNLH